MTEFETGDYTDLIGRKWFCVADHKKKQMVCDSDDGYFTCASFTTFQVWGWKPSLPQAERNEP
jgi:hypothetical protein